MRFFSILSIATIATLASVNAAPAPAPKKTAGSDPVSQFFVSANNLCEDLRQTMGTQQGASVTLGVSVGLKRDEPEFEALEKRQKAEVIGPALPLGRKYKVVPGSRGFTSNTEDYFPIGNDAWKAGICLPFSYGGSFFQGIFVKADPLRILFPASLIGNNFDTAVKMCQAACDSQVRLQGFFGQGDVQCNAITPWISIPVEGDIAKPLGDFVVCDLWSRLLSTHQISRLPQVPIRNGLLANAVGNSLLGGLLGGDNQQQ